MKISKFCCIVCFRKAIKFYIQDLCINPSRLDSWAGMALARMSQLEQKLSSVSHLSILRYYLQMKETI